MNIIPIFDDVGNPKNIAACLRTCDAVGITTVWIIRNPNIAKYDQFVQSMKISASASKHVTYKFFDTVEQVHEEIRTNFQKDVRIYTTFLFGPTKRYDPSHASKVDAETVTQIANFDLYEFEGFVNDTCFVVFGNENRGVEDSFLKMIDNVVNITIPQVGCLQSLNISVAFAIIIYEFYRQTQQMIKKKS